MKDITAYRNAILLSVLCFAAAACGSGYPPKYGNNHGNPLKESGTRHCANNAECQSGVCGGEGLCR